VVSGGYDAEPDSVAQIQGAKDEQGNTEVTSSYANSDKYQAGPKRHYRDNRDDDQAKKSREDSNTPAGEQDYQQYERDHYPKEFWHVCPPGFYSEGGDRYNTRPKCQRCPKTTIGSTRPGARSVSECGGCKPGFGTGDCTVCPPNTFSQGDTLQTLQEGDPAAQISSTCRKRALAVMLDPLNLSWNTPSGCHVMVVPVPGQRKGRRGAVVVS
jgi:hypothetical protein